MGEARLALVGGCGSSGTTLLTHLLSRHPLVATAPELNFFNHPESLDLARFADSLDALLARRRLTPGYKQVATFLGPRRELDLSRARLADWAARARDAAELHRWLAEHVCARVGATHFVEKTPTNVYAFARLARESPDVRLVHLIRDGRDVAASLAQRGRNLFAAGSRWLYDTLAGRRARESPAYLELRYEDLVTDTQATLARVFAHLGLPDPGPTQAEPSGQVPEPWRRKRAAARWSRTPDQPVSAASVGRFRDDLDDPALALLLRIRLTARAARALDAPVASFAELLLHLGYAPCAVPRVRARDGAAAWLTLASDAARRSLRSLRYTGRPVRPLTTLGPVGPGVRSGGARVS
ncbi:MAG TPA: sulfotransferase [Myxococcota bacterium]|nr:sulfotransferase [Myxococcota bacterium]